MELEWASGNRPRAIRTIFFVDEAIPIPIGSETGVQFLAGRRISTFVCFPERPEGGRCSNRCLTLGLAHGLAVCPPA